MKDHFFNIYLRIFGRRMFYKFHKRLAIAGLKGMGILNFQSFRLSGERYALDFISNNFSVKTVFDIGANNGNWSIICTKKFPGTKIFAFEPHPKNFEKLVNNISQPAIFPINIGFSDVKGKIKIYDYAKSDGTSHASTFEGAISDIHHAKSISFEIYVNTIDDYIEENDIHQIDLLKIDTEGNELKILTGASKSLRSGKIRIIQFEFGSPNVISRTFFKDFYDLLKEHYSIYRLLPAGLLPIESYHPLLHESFGYQNLLAVSKID